MSEKPRVLAVVGPTASGKSALAVTLCKLAGGEVISCDSMQIYRGMDIGTAKPTAAERAGVPHHLIDVADPAEPFSAADYAAAAERVTADVLGRGKLPVFCGGTGLYLDTFLRGAAPETPGGDAALRAELLQLAAQRGEKYLHEQLQAVDPESAAATHPHHVRRVVRALEIYRATGVPKSEWDRRSRAVSPRYEAMVIGLTFRNRQLLYDRIDARVDAMLAAGLEDETARLAAAGVFERSPTAAAAIGYKELLPYLAGKCSREEAVCALKQATRRYAKRQITWFGAKPYVRPLPVDDGKNMLKYEEIVNNARALCQAGGLML